MFGSEKTELSKLTTASFTYTSKGTGNFVRLRIILMNDWLNLTLFALNTTLSLSLCLTTTLSKVKADSNASFVLLSQVISYPRLFNSELFITLYNVVYGSNLNPITAATEIKVHITKISMEYLRLCLVV